MNVCMIFFTSLWENPKECALSESCWRTPVAHAEIPETNPRRIYTPTPPTQKEKQWLPQPLRVSSFWSYYRLINGWWAKLQAWSFIIQNWDLIYSPTKPTNSSPKKGRNFQQENTFEPTIDFQGTRNVSFQGSFPWLKTMRWFVVRKLVMNPL